MRYVILGRYNLDTSLSLPVRIGGQRGARREGVLLRRVPGPGQGRP